MSTYIIGDVQGCYQELQALLKHIHFNPRHDALWFAGDLVNRGPRSLDVLRFVSNLENVIAVLGNHDLTLLALAYTDLSIKSHTLDSILTAPDCESLLTWLRNQPLLYENNRYNIVLVHAGIPPQWSITEAKHYAEEVEAYLTGDNFKALLKNMFGNQPQRWCNSLQGWERYRFIINGLTRLRFCSKEGTLDFSYKGDIASAPSSFIPWFKFPLRDNKDNKKIIFGHWAALEGKAVAAHVEALDTGCFWGGCLTALRLEDHKRFVVSCDEKRMEFPSPT
jgi:bis(5'-nucleosyl)-tetraphosphatase (symmetrical)